MGAEGGRNDKRSHIIASVPSIYPPVYLPRCFLLPLPPPNPNNQPTHHLPRQEYLALIGKQEASRRAQRLALDLYRKCRSVRELRALARAFAISAPQVCREGGREGGTEGRALFSWLCFLFS